jgi:putative peptide zinc metalloprotease protein
MRVRSQQGGGPPGTPRAGDHPPAAPAPSAGNAPEPVGPPRLAVGVELLGEFRNSGYSQPPSLVRRADGQVIQMSRLLYSIACRINGSRELAAIADLVSEDLGRPMTADQVRYLITVKLLPLGVIDGQAPQLPAEG